MNYQNNNDNIKIDPFYITNKEIIMDIKVYLQIWKIVKY